MDAQTNLGTIMSSIFAPIPNFLVGSLSSKYPHYKMAANTDRRRNNAPSGGTHAPIFARTLREPEYLQTLRPTRTRGPNELRRICK